MVIYAQSGGGASKCNFPSSDRPTERPTDGFCYASNYNNNSDETTSICKRNHIVIIGRKTINRLLQIFLHVRLSQLWWAPPPLCVFFSLGESMKNVRFVIVNGCYCRGIRNKMQKDSKDWSCCITDLSYLLIHTYVYLG